ncbi:MAG: hypothetical protein ABI534_02235 [Chloroflexota bacterium]
MPGPIETTSYQIRVDMPPEPVIDALVDFWPDRARIWRETSHPAVYRLHRLGETDADVTEGVPFSWSREHYDWSTPGVVMLTQLDSNVAQNGTIRYQIRPDGAGSLITCDRRREFFGRRGRVAGTFMVLLGRSVLIRQLRAGLERARP